MKNLKTKEKFAEAKKYQLSFKNFQVKTPRNTRPKIEMTEFNKVKASFQRRVEQEIEIRKKPKKERKSNPRTQNPDPQILQRTSHSARNTGRNTEKRVSRVVDGECKKGP